MRLPLLSLALLMGCGAAPPPGSENMVPGPADSTGGTTSSGSSGNGANGGGAGGTQGGGGGTGGTSSVGTKGGSVALLHFGITGDTRPPACEDTANYPTAVIKG